MHGLFEIALPLLLAAAGLYKIWFEQRRRRSAGGDPDSDYETRRRRQYHSSLFHLSTGALCIALAIVLLRAPWGIVALLGGFSLAAGYQLLLNALGLRHELLANRAEPLPAWGSLFGSRSAEDVRPTEAASTRPRTDPEPIVDPVMVPEKPRKPPEAAESDRLADMGSRRFG